MDQRANRTDFFWFEFGSVRFVFFSKRRFEFGSVRLHFWNTGSGSVRFDWIFKKLVRVRFGSVRFRSLLLIFTHFFKISSIRFDWISKKSVRFDFIFGKPVRVRFGLTKFSKRRFEFGSVRFVFALWPLFTYVWFLSLFYIDWRDGFRKCSFSNFFFPLF
jgi:hypothetical protein